MKKIKYFLVAVMAVILCFMCLMTTTFSWFARETQSGNSLLWQGEYNVSNGDNITMETYKLNTSNGEYEKVASDYSFSNSNGISADSRISYRTDITNTGNAEQSVSLYMSGLKVTQGNFYLGVNNPLKTYKLCSGGADTPSTRVASQVNLQNVYVGLHKDEISDLIFHFDFIHSYKGNDYKDIELTSGKDTGDYGQYYPDKFPDGSKKWDGKIQEFKMYAIPVPSTMETYQIKATADTVGSKYENNAYSGWFETPQATIAANQLLIFYEYGEKYYVELENSEPAAKLLSFYSEATVYSGKTVDIPATGHNITYKSSNDSIATVSSVGKVTGKKAGTVKITATSTGVYGDTIESECEVTVKEADNSDIPIVTNYAVPGRKNGNDTVVSVYWYINNEGSETLKYEIGDVYLSL